MNDRLIFPIPFQGFYNSELDACLDDEIERECGFDEAEDGELESLSATVAWGATHVQCAKEYARQFFLHIADACKRLEIEPFDFQFAELSSPREYNFSTDTLLVSLPNADIARMRQATLRTGALRDLVREELQPRSGFMPFYSADLNNWPSSVLDWESAQLGLLLRAFIVLAMHDDDHNEDGIESAIIEHMRCNGDFHNSIVYYPEND